MRSLLLVLGAFVILDPNDWHGAFGCGRSASHPSSAPSSPDPWSSAESGACVHLTGGQMTSCEEGTDRAHCVGADAVWQASRQCNSDTPRACMIHCPAGPDLCVDKLTFDECRAKSTDTSLCPDHRAPFSTNQIPNQMGCATL